jgi:conjugal transfer ATP-binding protein TraC
MAEQLKSVVDRLLSGLLGDAEHADKARPQLMVDMLSDWLPYRVPIRQRAYFNARSKGFVLSVTPLIGADERTGEILGQFFPKACRRCLPAGPPLVRASAGSSPVVRAALHPGRVYEAIARHRRGLIRSSGSPARRTRPSTRGITR